MYDDESYVMMTIKTFLEGDRLYAETYTQYGPAYYMFQQPLHGWFGVPITHDVVRFKTVAAWVLIGLLCGFVAAKVTGKQLVGIAAMMLAVLHLEKLGLEPAHPQEMVTVLAMLCLAMMGSRKRSLLFLAGVCAAFAGLAKLNAGATSAAACLFAAGMVSVDSRRVSRMSAIAGCVIATAVAGGVFATIAKRSMESAQWTTAIWPLIIFGSCLLVCAQVWFGKPEAQAEVASKPGEQSFSFLAIAAGGIVGSSWVIAWSMLHGNSLHEILHGVVLQHGFMADSFYHPIQVDGFGMLFVVPAVLMLLLRFTRPAEQVASIDRVLFAFPPIVLAIAFVQMSVDSCKVLDHGLNPRGAAFFLATVGPAMMPVLLLKKQPSQLRLALAMLGCLSPVLAFPVPGTQVSLGTLPILIALVISTSDAIEIANRSSNRINSPSVFRRSTLAVAAVVLFSTGVFGYRWVANIALDQPGCRLVRLEAGRVETERAIAECIRSIDSPWLAFDSHNHNRFFFWTGKKPLTSTSPTFWPAMLTESQKSKIESAARDAESICVVKINDERIRLSDYAPAIEQALFGSWQPVGQVGDWEIGLQKQP
ncbi:hypothetical protein [Mariniblastus fucicola]|nr:hypothetical protein [Mariniblastus fucicola]